LNNSLTVRNEVNEITTERTRLNSKIKKQATEPEQEEESEKARQEDKMNETELLNRNLGFSPEPDPSLQFKKKGEYQN